MSKGDQLLYEIAGKCSATAKSLQADLHALQNPTGSFRGAIKKSFHALTRKKELEQKKKDLDDCQRVLDIRILTRLDTKLIDTADAIDNLKQRMQALGVNTKNSVSKAIESISNESEKAGFRQGLLDNLMFADIFSRQEQILDAHKKTFDWIFKDSPKPENTHASKDTNYSDWLQGSADKIYWIYGKAGSGKSILMSFLAQDERTKLALTHWSGAQTTYGHPSSSGAPDLPYKRACKAF